MPPFLNTLTAIDEKLGLWLNMKEPAILSVAGSEPTSTQIAISPGWNFIGYPAHQARPVADVLAGVAYNSAWAYDPALSPSPWQSYDPDVPPFLNTLQEFTAARGYALNASSAGMLTVSNGAAAATSASAGQATQAAHWLVPVTLLGLSLGAGSLTLRRRPPR